MNSDDETPSNDTPADNVSPLRDSNRSIKQAVTNQALGADAKEVCSFCGKGPSEINAMVSKGNLRICDLCVNAARASIRDEST